MRRKQVVQGYFMRVAPRSFRTFILTAITIIGSWIQVSCDRPSSAATASPSAIAHANLSPVEVPVEGKEFKPPVRPEQLPRGAWYCDMGTVHWAQLKEGNHMCPICKMDLKKK